MTSAARKSANGVRTLANREIEWEFTVDRFGVRPETGDSESLKVEFARRAVSSLSHWSQTVELLYGDAAGVIALATNAGFLPQYPYWQSVAQTIETLQGRLMPQRSRGAGDGFSAVAAPDSYAAAQTIDEKIIDPRTQDLVEQLRLYLEEMQKWAPVFRAATWVASLAGTGSTMSTAQGRLLQGLKSVIAVYELDATPDPAAIMKRFAGVLSGSDALSPLLPQLQGVLKQGENLLHYSGSAPEFAPDPTLFYQWLQEFRDSARDYPHQSSAVPATSWNALEDAYWAQWKWPPMGAVSRINPGGTIAGGTVGTNVGEVSALDLIYTTRYGSVPLLHWRGGHLSMCQWSRILTIASLRGTTALQAPRHAGIGNLGFGAPAKPPDSDSGPGDGGSIVMISPFTEHSAVWTWRPEPGICAFARVPRRLAEDDEEASRFGSDIDITAPVRPATDGWTEVADRVAQGDHSSMALLHFVEMAGGELPEASPVSEQLLWVSWKKIGFGVGQAGPSQRFVSGSTGPPRSLGELIDLTRKAYPEVFPARIDESDTAFDRFLYHLGRWIRSTRYEMLRGFAMTARFLGLARARRRLASFIRMVRGFYLRR
jgi:hypothetical protein